MLLAGVSLKVTTGRDPGCGADRSALSLLLGPSAFSASDVRLARFGVTHRKRCGDCIAQPTESQRPGSGAAIILGNALDAAPEAMVCSEWRCEMQ